MPADAFPLRVRFPAGTCGLARDSDALIDQILAWDNALFRTDLGELPEPLQDRIRESAATDGAPLRVHSADLVRAD